MKLIPTAISQKVGRQILTAQKSSPKILFAAGIGGVVVSTVLACRATLKLEKTLIDMKAEVEEFKTEHEDVQSTNGRKDLAYIYAKNTYKLGKLYAPAVLVGAASISALTSSHVTLTRRNASLTAAYAAVATSFEAYRERVREELGTERERDIHHAAKAMKISSDGRTETLMVADPTKWSPYARFFDEGNINWQKDPEFNQMFIKSQQNYLNHRLIARGHVFLNEAYDALGFDRSPEGQIVGWIVDGDGDGHIDFGLYTAGNVQFLKGWERNVILDFNVDGPVWDRI